MINGQIIPIESNFNSFNVVYGFNTKAHFSKGDVLMNLNVRDDDINVKISQGKHQVDQSFVEH
jgi:hypothetical protein